MPQVKRTLTFITQGHGSAGEEYTKEVVLTVDESEVLATDVIIKEEEE